MDPITLSAIGSAGGALVSGLFGQSSANKQMRFQERMASTQAQRAVKDFRAAGLNPALAYGNTASAPGGASAQLGNIGEAGVSSAMAAKRLKEELAIMRAQSAADLALKQANTQESAARGAATLANADLARGQLQSLMRENVFRLQEQPFQLRSQIANTLLLESQTPRRDLIKKGWEAARSGVDLILSNAPALSRFLSGRQ